MGSATDLLRQNMERITTLVAQVHFHSFCCLLIQVGLNKTYLLSGWICCGGFPCFIFYDERLVG